MTATASITQYLTFIVAGQEYGVDVADAREVIEVGALTTVPNAPECIRGVINLRGRVVPVMDLAVRLGRRPAAATRHTCLVIAELRRGDEVTVMGVVADRVSRVIDLAPGDIEPAPDFGTGAPAEWITGLGRAGEKFVVLLAVDRVLGSLLEPAVAV